MLPAFALSIYTARKTEAALVNAALGVVCLFGVAMVSVHFQRLLSTRALLFLGFISYPLYLVHENVMVSLIGTVGRLAPWMPPASVPLLPIGLVITIGWLLATHVEPRVRSAVSRWPRGSPFFLS